MPFNNSYYLFAYFFFLFTKNRFACLNLIALTVFTEMWKRRSNEHAFYFGTYGKLRHKRPRPAFRGKFEKNPITGREEVCTYKYFSVTSILEHSVAQPREYRVDKNKAQFYKTNYLKNQNNQKFLQIQVALLI